MRRACSEKMKHRSVGGGCRTFAQAKTVEVYSPTTNTRSRAAPMPKASWLAYRSGTANC